MSGKAKRNFFVQAMMYKGQVSAKRLLGFEAFHLAFVILATQIAMKVICNIDFDLKPYFDSALIFSATSLGITMIEKFSKQNNPPTNE